ncbi:hypothetical protein GF1_01460 [Desulfolithobacter dissulfuricans]|uniref:Uncharacterized protein n=1 Tax=Desulfolithobacter dissulfuricans TaxID=2795293 RepID=A0A915TYW5_9BACT|nr:hypothetical protein GF1_01460 [Desulfolithobacter dissulfuricans]
MFQLATPAQGRELKHTHLKRKTQYHCAPPFLLPYKPDRDERDKKNLHPDRGTGKRSPALPNLFYGKTVSV